MMESSEVEAFTAMQAVYSALADEVSTREPRNARARIDAHFRELYERTGARSFDLRAGGVKRGTYSVRVSGATERRRLRMVDEAAYLAWARANGLTRETVDERAVQALMDETGEVPDGVEVEIAREPEAYEGGSVRLTAETRELAARAVRGGAVAGLLEGGERWRP
ncbi:hypothetical protein HLV35_07415 [Eggerthellaceae bacterium zg-997]|nr:hypothetical protein [Eggerthellaceae bacterium zg-997]